MCDQGGQRGAAGEAQLGQRKMPPSFLPLGFRRVAHTGPPSLLVTGQTPVTLRNTAQGLPWRLSGEESAHQCRRHRLYPWSGRIPRASEQLSPCTPRMELRSRARELHLLKPPHPGAPAPQQERSTHHPATRGEPKQQQRPSTAKIRKHNYVKKRKEALHRPTQGRLTSHPGSRRPSRLTHEMNCHTNT